MTGWAVYRGREGEAKLPEGSGEDNVKLEI